jgi:hypothetical protein
MKESLDKAMSELRRADHLIYVSLKYIRTVDVIRSVINRLMAGLDFGVIALLELAKHKKKIEEYPKNIALRCALVKKLYKDEKIIKHIDFYLKLRRIMRADYKKSSEYRRHVTMTALTDEGLINIDIDKIEELYKKSQDFLELVRKKIEGE